MPVSGGELEDKSSLNSISAARPQTHSPVQVAILQGLLSNASGGLASSVTGMVSALTSNTQVEPHVLGVLDPADPAAASNWGASVQAHRAYGPSGFHWAPAMARTLDSIAPDVIDTQGIWMNQSRIALARHVRYATPLVVTPHGMLDPWAVRRSSLRKRLVRLWFEDKHLSRAAAIRALNEDEAKAIRQFGVQSPIVVVPNGIEPPEASRVSDIEDREKVLQFLGRLDPKKGLEPLFKAWSLLKREPAAKDWRLRVNGWGATDYVDTLHMLVADLSLGNSLDLGGPVFGADKENVLATSAGFILPSYSEGLPMAVLEAWSWGTPVLMTRACNLPEGFAQSAALEITTDPKELVRQLLEYMKMSSEDRRAMAVTGRRLVDTKFHAKAVARDLERLYRWTAGFGALPDELIFDE
jgi:glycosyltransferase involved in cell wall biosynthesis